MIKSIVKFSQLDDRLDSKYYKPEYFNLIQKINNSVQLKELLIKNNRGKQPNYSDNKTEYLVLKTRDVDGQFCNVKNLPSITENNYSINTSAQLKTGDVILNSTGVGSICRPAIWYSDKKAITDGHVAILRSNGISQELLFVYLLSKIGQKLLEREISGATGQIEIYPVNIGSIKFPNILIKLDSEIKELIKKSYAKKQLSEQKYQQAQNLLNDYLSMKDQVIRFKTTFSLPFSQLENRLDGEYYQPKTLLDLPMFNNGFVKLGDITDIRMGKTPPKHSYTQNGIRILKVKNLTNKGIDWSTGDRSYVSNLFCDKTAKAKLQQNDILLISAAHQAYYIGKEVDIVFDIPKEYDNKLLAVAELLIIRPKKEINPFALLWYLRTPIAYQFIQQFITGETSHLYPKDLINLPVPKLLLDLKDTARIEHLTKDSILLSKESNQLLEDAKQKVEEMIEKSI